MGYTVASEATPLYGVEGSSPSLGILQRSSKQKNTVFSGYGPKVGHSVWSGANVSSSLTTLIVSRLVKG